MTDSPEADLSDPFLLDPEEITNEQLDQIINKLRQARVNFELSPDADKKSKKKVDAPSTLSLDDLLGGPTK